MQKSTKINYLQRIRWFTVYIYMMMEVFYDLDWQYSPCTVHTYTQTLFLLLLYILQIAQNLVYTCSSNFALLSSSSFNCLILSFSCFASFIEFMKVSMIPKKSSGLESSEISPKDFAASLNWNKTTHRSIFAFFQIILHTSYHINIL